MLEKEQYMVESILHDRHQTAIYVLTRWKQVRNQKCYNNILTIAIRVAKCRPDHTSNCDSLDGKIRILADDSNCAFRFARLFIYFIYYHKFHLKVFGFGIEQNILHLFQEIKINIKSHLSEILYLNRCTEIYRVIPLKGYFWRIYL